MGYGAATVLRKAVTCVVLLMLFAIACMSVTLLHSAMTAYEMIFKPSGSAGSPLVHFCQMLWTVFDLEMLPVWQRLLLEKSQVGASFINLMC